VAPLAEQRDPEQVADSGDDYASRDNLENPTGRGLLGRSGSHLLKPPDHAIKHPTISNNPIILALFSMPSSPSSSTFNRGSSGARVNGTRMRRIWRINTDKTKEKISENPSDPCHPWCATKARKGGRKGHLKQPNCIRDEGGPLGLGLQGQSPNHLKLLRLNDRGGERSGKEAGKSCLRCVLRRRT
jgi:hypothetical protein